MMCRDDRLKKCPYCKEEFKYAQGSFCPYCGHFGWLYSEEYVTEVARECAITE